MAEHEPASVTIGPRRNCRTWVHNPDLRCISCGKRAVFFCDDGGDYYVGEGHVCAQCGQSFTIQVGGKYPSPAEGGKGSLTWALQTVDPLLDEENP